SSGQRGTRACGSRSRGRSIREVRVPLRPIGQHDHSAPRQRAGHSAVTKIGSVGDTIYGSQGSGDVTAGIGGFATTGNVSKAIASLRKAWSRKNVRIGQAGVGKELSLK